MNTSLAPKCEICGRGMNEGITLYRVNAIGPKGIWRCKNCLTSTHQAALDPETERLITIIEKGHQPE